MPSHPGKFKTKKKGKKKPGKKRTSLLASKATFRGKRRENKVV